MKYEVVDGNLHDLDGFERDVNSYLSTGWEPLGGVVAVHNPARAREGAAWAGEDYDSDESIQLIQTLVRR